MRFAQSPAVEDHLIAALPVGVVRGLDRARKIDAGDHWESPHDRRLAGDREAVLVVERRPFDADRDVALHEVPLVEIGERGLRAALRFVDHDRFEGRHGQPAGMRMSVGKIAQVVAGVPRLVGGQAGAAAARTTGFSTIGRLMTAESTPNRIESHHTTSYEPVRTNATPPSQTPRKPPTW